MDLLQEIDNARARCEALRKSSCYCPTGPRYGELVEELRLESQRLEELEWQLEMRTKPMVDWGQYCQWKRITTGEQLRKQRHSEGGQA